MTTFTVSMRLEADNSDALLARLEALGMSEEEWVVSISEVPAMVPIPPSMQPPAPKPPSTGRRIDSVEPNSGPKAGGTAITIRGSGFTNIGGVRFEGDGQPGWAWSFAVIDDSTVTCPTPPMGAGAVDVIVFNGDPGEAKLEGGFTYT